MSDVLSTEFKPTKNAYGIPTGEPMRLPTESPVEGVEQSDDVVQDTEEQEENLLAEGEEQEAEEDILAATLSPDQAQVETEESELDRLRRQVDLLEGRLVGQTDILDRSIKREAEEVSDVKEELDYSDPQFRKAIGEKLQEDPSLMPVLVEEMLDRKLKTHARKLESFEKSRNESAVNMEQMKILQKNLYEGFNKAEALGGLEKKLVEEIQVAVETGKPEASHVLMFLDRNPQFVNSAEGIEAAVVTLARRAEANADKRGIDISTMTRTPASDRGNRLLDKQNKPVVTEEDENERWQKEKFESMLSKRASPLGDLLK